LHNKLQSNVNLCFSELLFHPPTLHCFWAVGWSTLLMFFFLYLLLLFSLIMHFILYVLPFTFQSLHFHFPNFSESSTYFILYYPFLFLVKLCFYVAIMISLSWLHSTCFYFLTVVFSISIAPSFHCYTLHHPILV